MRWRQPVATGVVLLALLGALMVAAVVAPEARAQAGELPTGEVEVAVVVGDEGLVTLSDQTPVTITLTSPRARTVDVEVNSEMALRIIRTELPAETPISLDVALPLWATEFTSVDVSVHDGSKLVGSKSERAPVRSDATIVGVGESLVGAGAPEETPTIADIQTARLRPLDATAFSAPGVLGSMSSIVLAAADVDRLDDSQITALRRWVWQGGTLILDVAPTAELPVVGLPADPGATSAIGAGWVTFSDGRAGAGAWSDLVAPATLPVSDAAQFGGWWMGDGIGGVGLIDLSFLPWWVVGLVVTAAALLAGPLLWAFLGTRSRRQWMWVLAPAISMLTAVSLLLVGQGVLTDAQATAKATVASDAWTDTGSVAVGITRTSDIDVSGGTEIVAAEPQSVVSSTGGGQQTHIELHRNEFGAVQLSPITVSRTPTLEVTAVAQSPAVPDVAADIEVSVTNRSESTLRNVQVRGAGRSARVDRIEPGATVLVPLTAAAATGVLGSLYPFGDEAMDDGFIDDGSGAMGFGGAAGMLPYGPPLPRSQGVISVTAGFFGPTEVLGASVETVTNISTTAAVEHPQGGTAAVRLDAVGTVALADSTGLAPNGEAGPSPSTLRMFAPAGRPVAPCAVHTSVSLVELWNGAEWQAAAKVGEPFVNGRMAGPNEVQQWQMPQLGVGGSTYLRLTSVLEQPSSPLLVDCGAGS